VTSPVSMLAEFDQEMKSTRRVLERVPRKKAEWRPHPKSFPIGHLAHHRGQMTVYLRLLDIPVPSVYGPTADERW